MQPVKTRTGLVVQLPDEADPSTLELFSFSDPEPHSDFETGSGFSIGFEFGAGSFK